MVKLTGASDRAVFISPKCIAILEELESGNVRVHYYGDRRIDLKGPIQEVMDKLFPKPKPMREVVL